MFNLYFHESCTVDFHEIGIQWSGPPDGPASLWNINVYVFTLEEDNKLDVFIIISWTHVPPGVQNNVYIGQDQR